PLLATRAGDENARRRHPSIRPSRVDELAPPLTPHRTTFALRIELADPFGHVRLPPAWPRLPPTLGYRRLARHRFQGAPPCRPSRLHPHLGPRRGWLGAAGASDGDRRLDNAPADLSAGPEQ